MSKSEQNKSTVEDIQQVDQLSPKPKKGKKIAFLLLLVLIIAALLYYFLYFTKTDSYKQQKIERETKMLVERVRALMVLPKGEPVIFDVQDPDVLKKQQAFFNDAQKGDKLLIYAESGKAIIYSPSKNIIVNAGPVTFDQTKDDTQSKQELPEPNKEEN